MNIFYLVEFFAAVFSDILILEQKTTNFFKLFFKNFCLEKIEFLIDLNLFLRILEMKAKLILNEREIVVKFGINLVEERV